MDFQERVEGMNELSCNADDTWDLQGHKLSVHLSVNPYIHHL